MPEEIIFYLKVTAFYGEFPEIPNIVDMASLEFESLIDIATVALGHYLKKYPEDKTLTKKHEGQEYVPIKVVL
jgi:predicted RNase H-like HicB family nuclease